GSASIAGSVRYAGMTATFTPASDLSSNTFTATISRGAKSAASATGLAGDYTWSFTTVSIAGAPPSVNSTDPGNSSTGVATNKQVSASFSQAMDPATITALTFTLKQGNNSILGSVSYAGKTAVFAPTNPLANNTTYSATVTNGSKDQSGT